jgi:hypothetical protein
MRTRLSKEEGREEGPLGHGPPSGKRRRLTMLQSVSLSLLQPAAANPRRRIDRKAI